MPTLLLTLRLSQHHRDDDAVADPRKRAAEATIRIMGVASGVEVKNVMKGFPSM